MRLMLIKMINMFNAHRNDILFMAMCLISAKNDSSSQSLEK